MSDQTANPCPSPCVHECRLDLTGSTCVGCRRTTTEIMAWRGLSDAERRRVLERLRREG